jgi:hypothetical protein
MKSEMLKSILKGIWAFCSYVFVPQRGRHPKDDETTKATNP